MHILGISGSIRNNSSNGNILHAAFALLPENFTFKIFDKLEQIPPFNPGADDNNVIKNFKKLVYKANGVIICTPEYAFGVPGILKNLLDWTVSTGEFNQKPVCAISASPLNSGGDKALASLLLTLTALGAKMNEQSSLSIANVKMKLDDSGKVTDKSTVDQLKSQITNLLLLV